jgi:hypothetical protein
MISPFMGLNEVVKWTFLCVNMAKNLNCQITIIWPTIPNLKEYVRWIKHWYEVTDTDEWTDMALNTLIGPMVLDL